MKRFTFAHEWIGPLALIVGVSCVAWFFVFSVMNPVELLTYLHAAHAVVHGQSPYPRPNGHTLLGGHAYVYPLLVSVLYTPLSSLSAHAATIVTRIFSIAALVVAAGLLRGRLGVAVAAIALCSTPVLVAVQVGSLEPFLLLGIVISYRFRDRPLISGAVLALTSVAKLFLAPLLFWPLIVRRSRMGAAAWIVTVVIGLGGAIITPGVSTYINILLHLSHNESASGWSLPGIAADLIHSTRVAELGVGLIIVLPLCALVWKSYRPKSENVSERVLLGLLITLALVLSPIAWSHYFVLMVFPLLCTKRPVLMVGLFTELSWILETPDQISTAAIGPALIAIAIVTVLAQRTIKPWKTPSPSSVLHRLRDTLERSLRRPGDQGRRRTITSVFSHLRPGTRVVLVMVLLAVGLGLALPNSIDAIVVQTVIILSVLTTISHPTRLSANNTSTVSNEGMVTTDQGPLHQ